MNKGEITAGQAQTAIYQLNSGIDSVLKDPNSTTRYFKGDTYKWWSQEINQPPVENLIKLKIPILLVHGSSDTKVPIESADYIEEEFIRQKKQNLTYKVYLNCDHDFRETLPNGEIKNHWTDIFFDFLKFIDTKNSR